MVSGRFRDVVGMRLYEKSVLFPVAARANYLCPFVLEKQARPDITTKNTESTKIKKISKGKPGGPFHLILWDQNSSCAVVAPVGGGPSAALQSGVAPLGSNFCALYLNRRLPAEPTKSSGADH